MTGVRFSSPAPLHPVHPVHPVHPKYANAQKGSARA
jgi:hypothetical protein